MRLNIEQYEYMVGPNPGAGIKLLIHENTEVPLVRDLGNAIPPGTHAYVGIQIVQVSIHVSIHAADVTKNLSLLSRSSLQ